MPEPDRVGRSTPLMPGSGRRDLPAQPPKPRRPKPREDARRQRRDDPDVPSPRIDEYA